ncbi:hypothetical protein PM035_10410 [Halorubrum ezzemoulense]|uniref:hypothetical protein n=1 Tax=Halorubrum ezzemoulense TaxID=337243 RepID=UPI00232AA6EB|nr:hypothetical protein [Halorubrum ezzemoulense]MDB2260617.1 hypothetical protein [Halorubrum ezzemoulense]MDB2268111.1 hypothetical protein [Halorubrum ezzemoulense]
MTRPGNSHAAALSKFTRIALDTTDPICQVCGQPLNEGDDITAYAYRAAGEPTYAIGYIMCGSDRHEHPTVFTRGVCEYVLTGHIGTCSNTRTQSTTFVLLDPTIVVTSPTTATEPNVNPDAPTPRDPTQPTQRDPPPLLTAVREHARPDGGCSREGSE